MAGRPTVLIEHGRVLRKALAKELVSEPELAIVAHRQGFARLDEVEHCTLEPGGTFYMQGRRKESGEGQIVSHLEEISRRLAAVEQHLSKP